jgi:predicted amino acid-binding ACT domain protein
VLVDWSAAAEDAFSVKLSIYGQDRKSLLADIAKAIATTNTNIRTAGIKANDRNARGAFVVEVQDLAHLRRVMRAIEQVEGVDAVEREQVFGRSRGGESVGWLVRALVQRVSRAAVRVGRGGDLADRAGAPHPPRRALGDPEGAEDVLRSVARSSGSSRTRPGR